MRTDLVCGNCGTEFVSRGKKEWGSCPYCGAGLYRKDNFEVIRDKEMGGGNYNVFKNGEKVGEIFRIPSWDVKLGLNYSAVDSDSETIHQFATLREAKESLLWLYGSGK